MAKQITLEIPDQAYVLLEQMRKRIRVDALTEVIRRALIAYDFLTRQQEAGAVIRLVYPDGDVALFDLADEDGQPILVKVNDDTKH